MKRDMDVARDEVPRHDRARRQGAGGPGGGAGRYLRHAERPARSKLFFPVDPLAPQGEPLFAWSPKMASDPPLLALERLRLRRADEGEHRRLLYVAMTRAEERLVVTGFEGKRLRGAPAAGTT